jgi:hypothetical protein
MPKIPIYLYDRTYTIHTNLDTYQQTGYLMYQPRITLYKGVKNTIQFELRNDDQKKQFINNKTFIFELTRNDGTRLLRKDVTILDDGSTTSNKGKCKVEITDSDSLGIYEGFYHYTIKEVQSDGSETPIFVDVSYGARGQIEVTGKAFPQLVDSVSVTEFFKSFDSGSTTYYTSSVQDADLSANSNSALHTIAVYPNSFSGTVKIQGSLLTDPSASTEIDNADFIDISSTNFSGATTVSYINFTGNYNKVRFAYTPTSGSITKILYRP